MRWNRFDKGGYSVYCGPYEMGQRLDEGEEVTANVKPGREARQKTEGLFRLTRAGFAVP